MESKMPRQIAVAKEAKECSLLRALGSRGQCTTSFCLLPWARDVRALVLQNSAAGFAGLGQDLLLQA